jgi:hypothetical protein
MFRFTIRDVLWLMAVVAAWFAADRYRAMQTQQRDANMTRLLNGAVGEINRLNNHWDGAQQALDDAGIEWPPKGR